MLVALVFNRALICATVPVIVTDEAPELVTTAPLLPAVTVSVPSVTASVTVMEPEPASTSLIDRPLFLSVERRLLGRRIARRRDRRHRRVVDGGDVDRRGVAGDQLPPVPVLPLSLMVSVSVALALGVSVLSV